MSAKLISIIGPPAAGKTTLATALCRCLQAELIKEDYQSNPFLEDCYEGKPQARLPSQLYFLLSRVSQLAITDWPAGGLFISDYGFCQDHVYAEQLLAEHELRLYNRLVGRLEKLVHRPDIMVVLEASENSLLERIHLRGRDFENSMTAEFLGGMTQTYNKIAGQTNCPVITIDTDKTDIRLDKNLTEIVSSVRKYL